MTALQTLSLWNTQVSDITPLATMKALQWLYLGHTQVSDIAALSGISDLTVYVETEERAEALLETLAPESKVTVKVKDNDFAPL